MLCWNLGFGGLTHLRSPALDLLGKSCAQRGASVTSGMFRENPPYKHLCKRSMEE